MGVFFVLVCYFLYLPVAHAKPVYTDSCNPNVLSSPESATVKWVYDGDTLLLTDKRKIRIIGIDTPEVKHHKQKKQAFSAQAKEALRELLKKFNYKILLRYGDDKEDRYSRTLAHVYTPDGTNVANWLLENGFATTLVFPPNVKLAHCFKTSELQAQQEGLGIWSLEQYQIKKADTLAVKVKGKIRLKGKIIKIIRHKKSINMELDSASKRHIDIKITKKNFPYFKNLDTDKLWDKTVIISGYLKNKRNKRIIILKHPSQLRIIKRRNVKPTINWSLKNAN